MITHKFPAGGWLPIGAHFDWQRSDQGRDFATDWRGDIQAPGSGECVAVQSDHPFPNGFGPAYPIVRIDTGRFAGHEWYLGHCTSLVQAGDRFSFGHALARADQGHNWAGTLGGWVELGLRQPDGSLGPFSASGHWFDNLLRDPLVIRIPDPPLRFGDIGPRVLQMTTSLWHCGYLTRPHLRFDRAVHGAVVAFKEHHHISMPPISKNPTQQKDRGVVDTNTALAIKHSGDWCKKHHKREFGVK